MASGWGNPCHDPTGPNCWDKSWLSNKWVNSRHIVKGSKPSHVTQYNVQLSGLVRTKHMNVGKKEWSPHVDVALTYIPSLYEIEWLGNLDYNLQEVFFFYSSSSKWWRWSSHHKVHKLVPKFVVVISPSTIMWTSCWNMLHVYSFVL